MHCTRSGIYMHGHCSYCGALTYNYMGPVIRYPLYFMRALYYIQIIYTSPGLYIFAHTLPYIAVTQLGFYNICGTLTYIKYRGDSPVIICHVPYHKLCPFYYINIPGFYMLPVAETYIVSSLVHILY